MNIVLYSYNIMIKVFLLALIMVCNYSYCVKPETLYNKGMGEPRMYPLLAAMLKITPLNMLQNNTSEIVESLERMEVDDFHKNMEVKNRHRRTRFTISQLEELRKSFKFCNYLTKLERTRLAEKLNLVPSVVSVWFQNKRQATKRSAIKRAFEALQMPMISNGNPQLEVEGQHRPKLNFSMVPKLLTQVEDNTGSSEYQIWNDYKTSQDLLLMGNQVDGSVVTGGQPFQYGNLPMYMHDRRF